MLTLRPHRRIATTLAAVVATTVLAAPPPAVHADTIHPCPLDINDYGSTIEWSLACVDHLLAHGDAGDDGTVCELVPNPWGIPIVCLHDTYGWWSNTIGCYLRPVSPQPPADDPVWDGHHPDSGTVYRLTCPWLEGVDGGSYWELPFDRYFPARSGMLGRLVERAVAQLVLTGPEVGIAPDPGGTGLVGLPVWMWTRVNARTWSPPPVRLSALGSTVVVEARVDRIVWDMGNGDVVVCDRGPGTPYQDHHGAARSPDCGYDGYARPSHTQPGGVYEVTATTHWLVRWRFEGTGVTGTESVPRQSSVQLHINELQVVTS